MAFEQYKLSLNLIHYFDAVSCTAMREKFLCPRYCRIRRNACVLQYLTLYLFLWYENVCVEPKQNGVRDWAPDSHTNQKKHFQIERYYVCNITSIARNASWLNALEITTSPAFLTLSTNFMNSSAVISSGPTYFF